MFFGTRHLLGSDKMKEAIWKTNPSGDYLFRGGQGNQLLLNDIIAGCDFTHLSDLLTKQFDESTWVSVEKVKAFISSDQTYYYTG